jgi:hypothetical protein
LVARSANAVKKGSDALNVEEMATMHTSHRAKLIARICQKTFGAYAAVLFAWNIVFGMSHGVEELCHGWQRRTFVVVGHLCEDC